MADKCLLFTYGMLMPSQSPPKSMSDAWPDRVTGELYDLGAFPAAIAIGNASDWFEGFVVEIDAEELPDLDHFEDVDSGEFRRITVTTEKGRHCWAYEYRQKIPPDLEKIVKWMRP